MFEEEPVGRLPEERGVDAQNLIRALSGMEPEKGWTEQHPFMEVIVPRPAIFHGGSGMRIESAVVRGELIAITGDKKSALVLYYIGNGPPKTLIVSAAELCGHENAEASETTSSLRRKVKVALAILFASAIGITATAGYHSLSGAKKNPPSQNVSPQKPFAPPTSR